MRKADWQCRTELIEFLMSSVDVPLARRSRDLLDHREFAREIITSPRSESRKLHNNHSRIFIFTNFSMITHGRHERQRVQLGDDELCVELYEQ